MYSIRLAIWKKRMFVIQLELWSGIPANRMK